MISPRNTDTDTNNSFQLQYGLCGYTAGVGVGGVRSVRTYPFKPDGTFTIESTGAVSNSATSAVTTSA